MSLVRFVKSSVFLSALPADEESVTLRSRTNNPHAEPHSAAGRPHARRTATRGGGVGQRQRRTTSTDGRGRTHGRRGCEGGRRARPAGGDGGRQGDRRHAGRDAGADEGG